MRPVADSGHPSPTSSVISDWPRVPGPLTSGRRPACPSCRAKSRVRRNPISAAAPRAGASCPSRCTGKERVRVTGSHSDALPGCCGCSSPRTAGGPLLHVLLPAARDTPHRQHGHQEAGPPATQQPLLEPVTVTNGTRLGRGEGISSRSSGNLADLGAAGAETGTFPWRHLLDSGRYCHCWPLAWGHTGIPASWMAGQ